MDFQYEMHNVYIFVQIILGLLTCFFGYRMFKIILGILGFFLGAALAGSFAVSAISDSQFALIFITIIGGIAGAVVLVAFYFLGVFLFGAGLGYLAGVTLCLRMGWSHEIIISFILAAVVGVLALLIQRFMIIVSTAFVGSWAVISGFYYLLNEEFHLIINSRIRESFSLVEEPSGLILLLLWILLAIVGIIIQYSVTAKKRTITYKKIT